MLLLKSNTLERRYIKKNNKNLESFILIMKIKHQNYKTLVIIAYQVARQQLKQLNKQTI